MVTRRTVKPDEAEKPSLYVCFGNPSKGHLESLEDAADADGEVTWTINRHARPGDQVILYLKLPLASFVATGSVESEPELEDDGEYEGHYMADIDLVRMLPAPVHIRDVRKAFPAWGWLQQPRRSTRVPDDIVGPFRKLLRGDVIEAKRAPASVLEGIVTEERRLTRKRSGKLRAMALKQSRGICCVCGRDFSRVLGGRGVRVLQVHHRTQLSATEGSQRTSLDDLAVVCANCHMLLHLEADRALEVEELRRMLIVDGDVGD